MDNNENKPQNDNALSSSALEYLFKRLLALETRIELLEEKNAAAPENTDELLSKANVIEKKLDLLIGMIQNTSEVNAIEDIGGDLELIPESVEAQSAVVKRQIAVFIDGENISNKKAEKIMEKSGNRGHIQFARVYGVKDTPFDKCWVKTSQDFNIKHIRLPGGSKKNKVDKHMFGEIYNEAKKKKHADMLIIATNDTDFIPTIKEVRDMGIYVVIMGLKSSLSDKMKKACDSFVYL